MYNKIITLIITMVITFILIVHFILLPNIEKNKPSKFIPVDSKNISIAITESNQLLIINKKTGEYQIFEDSIGLNIFKAYANNIYNNKPR